MADDDKTTEGGKGEDTEQAGPDTTEEQGGPATTAEEPDGEPRAAAEAEAGGDAEAERLRAQGEVFADQFKDAAQQVLQQRLGMKVGPDGKVDFQNLPVDDLKRGVQDVMLQLFGSLAKGMQQAAGAAPPAADAPEAPPATTAEEPHQARGAEATAEPGGGEDEADVIDLGEERRRRQTEREPSPFERQVGSNVRETLDGFLREAAERRGATGGTVNVDLGFLKDEGPALLGSMFGALARSFEPLLKPRSFEVTVPGGADDASRAGGDPEDHVPGAPQTSTSEAEASPEAPDERAATAEGGAGAGPAPIKLKVDLGGIFGGLFKPLADQLARAATQARPATERAPEAKPEPAAPEPPDEG